MISIVAAITLTRTGDDANVRNNPPGGSATLGPSAAEMNCGGKVTLKASGSTAQANAMARFVRAFEQACPGQTLNYTANGSGAGISEFIGKLTDFGGSDSPLSMDEATSAQQRCGSLAWNLPVVFGLIAATYNINTVYSLNLDGPTMAKIFNGGIKVWNDPAIQALNSGFTLPSEPIHVIFRSDQSGTTDRFQQYLDAASNGVWGRGAGKTFNGGVGEGAKGNDGTAAAIKATEGSITYNEWSFAQGQRLNMAKIVTSAGPNAVAISADSVGKTIAGANHLGPRERPGARLDVVVQAVPARVVSDRAGHLRDRLLEVSGRPGRHGREGIPAVHHRPRPKWLGGRRIHPHPERIQIEAVDRGQRHRII
jgi:phosphate transport system substrate-binding protein